MEQVLAATKAVDGGDVMNFDLAAEMAELEGIETVLATDDVASAPPDGASERRGVAGLGFAYKRAGAAAEAGGSLEEVATVAKATNANTRTMGVSMSPTILPAAREPTFTLAEDEMEIGIGIHGEPGVKRGPLEGADGIVDRLLGPVLDDLGVSSGDEVAVMVNGLGATPPEELYVMYRRVRQVLDGLGATVHRAYVGEYATSLEMTGASVSVMGLTDGLRDHLDAPASSPFIAQA